MRCSRAPKPTPPPLTTSPPPRPHSYAALVDSVLASNSAGSLDVCVLGMGEDGHTCSLFPDHPLLSVVGDDAPSVAYLTDSPKQPPTRLTLTYPVLNRSRLVLFCAAGEGKSEVFSKMMRKEEGGAEGVVKCEVVGDQPAGRVRAKEMRWLVDSGAVSKL